MTGRAAVTKLMAAFAADISAVLPKGMRAGAVGDWVVFTTRYGLDGFEAAAGIDDGASLSTIEHRLYNTLNAVQEAVIRHLTEPWPTLAGRPRHAGQGNVWLPDAVVLTEGSTLHPFYGHRAENVTRLGADEWDGDVVLDLPRVTWMPADGDAHP